MLLAFLEVINVSVFVCIKMFVHTIPVMYVCSFIQYVICHTNMVQLRNTLRGSLDR